MALITDAVGVAAGLCSMASFVPQIVKLVREKSAEGVSTRMFAITVTGFVLWTSYGVLLKSWPVIVSNAVCLGLTTTIFLLTLRFHKREAKAG